MSRFRVKRRHANGLFPGATVTRGEDWQWKNQDGVWSRLASSGYCNLVCVCVCELGGPGSTGQLLKVTNWKDKSYVRTCRVCME